MKVSQSEWLSRISLGTSMVALAVASYSCQDADLGKEPGETALVPAESPEAPNVGAISPDKLPVAPPVEKAEEAEPGAVAEAPVAEPPKAEEKPADVAELQIKRLVVTHAVENREPAPDVELVAGAQPVFAFVELANPADVEQEIVVTFEHESGKKVGFVSLKVPAGKPRWRTWGRTSQIKTAGHWAASVSVKDGAELKRTSFDVKAGAPKAPVVAKTGS